ncbi:hypothetical protein E4U42_005112 [Claviceps africana]|uniref:Uncharacterized protein n=1 Tax=Claviceps africana TaxID=83212 RepID=A0A8K0JCB9_9HYPO|nr:hypothetical protein E4U42_005112 [Claviceps africana]
MKFTTFLGGLALYALEAQATPFGLPAKPTYCCVHLVNFWHLDLDVHSYISRSGPVQFWKVNSKCTVIISTDQHCDGDNWHFTPVGCDEFEPGYWAVTDWSVCKGKP